MNRRTISWIQGIIYSPIILVLSIILIAMLLMSRESGRMQQQHVPQMIAAHQIMIEASLFHLWFEELVQGDQTVDVNAVWGHLDKAERYAEILLRGEKSIGIELIPTDNPRLIEKINLTIIAIHEMRVVGKARLANSKSSIGGSDSDQRFDAAFIRAMNLAEEVSSELKVIIDSSHPET